MCIALLTTAHPSYPLILLSNRDEHLSRPTAPASFWPPPHAHVLGGRDLLSPTHGTWLGIALNGRITVLTNFRDPLEDDTAARRSRGQLTKEWLTCPLNPDEGPEEWISRLASPEQPDSFTDFAGFSMMLGTLRPRGERGIQPLAVISNRTSGLDQLSWIGGDEGEVYGLSNSAYGDPWPKVGLGRRLLRDAVQTSIDVNEGEDKLLDRLWDVLTTDSMPVRTPQASFHECMENLRLSIFIPPLTDERVVQGLAGAGDEPARITYGTHQQTVILVRRDGRVTYIERTLSDEHMKPIDPGQRDRRFDFRIEGWS
ncbi:MAG: hypothetical protein M1824_000590 [Vezdaea acicularis]|nr:MAG: hypothetical protein M1824_000590 [Vezdaea acicularis]